MPIAEDDRRILPARLRQLVGYADGGAPSVAQLMELNREASGLDQEQAAGRFTLTRYILYLLPVIGFIGTVEGISKALMNISLVLPMVKDLDGFMSNLTGVTSALQIAFDSTLLALFLSAALMLVQTLVYRRSEDLLARVDRWVVEHVLPRLGRGGRDRRLKVSEAVATAPGAAPASTCSATARPAPRPVRRGRRPPPRRAGGLPARGRGDRPDRRRPRGLGTASDSLRRGVATLGRIENALSRRDRAARAARRDQARDRPHLRGHRGPLRLVGPGLRALEPGHPGAARPDPEQPQGRPRPAQRQHGAGQLALPHIVKKMFDDRPTADPTAA